VDGPKIHTVAGLDPTLHNTKTFETTGGQQDYAVSMIDVEPEM
jgi:hypothetical protein